MVRIYLLSLCRVLSECLSSQILGLSRPPTTSDKNSVFSASKAASAQIYAHQTA